MRCLIIEDDPGTAHYIQSGLTEAGHAAVLATDGDEGLRLASEGGWDAIILDRLLPGSLDGLSILAALRDQGKQMPVLILSALAGLDERVRGLRSGADDYLTKPFSLPELLARIKALLRRVQPAQTKGVLQYETIAMDLTAHRVTRAGRNIHLGPTEFRLLQFLLQHPGCVFSREELLNAVWGPDIYVEPRTVDVHIRRLRKALNGDGDLDIIRTVRAAGYALDMDGAEIVAVG